MALGGVRVGYLAALLAGGVASFPSSALAQQFGTASAIAGSGCVHDSDCADDQFCNASLQCEPQRAQGAECHPLANADCSEAGCDICQSGQCVDDVCCETACQGTCLACSQSRTGAPNGSCSPVLKNTDPRDDCEMSADACGHDGQCDGGGACQVAELGTTCGNDSCQGNSAAGLVCDGAGTCVSTVAIQCAPYICSGGSCTNACTRDAHCLPSAFCAEDQCHLKEPDGGPCAAKNQCASDFCVDGVCCNSACDGECESCSSGACLPQPPSACDTEGGASAGGAGTGDGGVPAAGSNAGGANSAGTPTTAGTGNAGSAPQGEGGCSGDECVEGWPMTNEPRDSSGCGCRVGTASSSGRSSPLAACALAVGLMRRRRRRAKLPQPPE